MCDNNCTHTEPDRPTAAPEQPDTGSRRQFLWDSVKTFSWGLVTLTVLPILAKDAVADDDDKGDKGDDHKDAAKSNVILDKDGNPVILFGFLVDTYKCIGCGNCMLACKKENHVPDNQFRTWVERYVYYKNGEVLVDTNRTEPFSFSALPPVDQKEVEKAFFVPKLCNHCVNTPCIQVCPVGASFMTKEGVVLIDYEQCIGCAYCVQACPFGTRFINHETRTADKCTWCYHRTSKGGKPACVEVCPSGTRQFGNIADPDSEISKVLAANRIEVLKSYLGTRPKTRYMGLTAEVV